MSNKRTVARHTFGKKAYNTKMLLGDKRAMKCIII